MAAELAKILTQTGVKHIVIYDNQKAMMRDIGTNRFIDHKLVGSNTRAEASIQQLSQLNANVKIETKALETPKCEDIKGFNIFIVTECFDQNQIKE